ncbi:MAG: 50S ribosomal protein L3 [Candidatus Woesearchaeota archaeon]|jgi:large subunit ribosomal protein L3|nr:50S ribosomal protein L3 [Candidatus Woesearchaeota archaeon]
MAAPSTRKRGSKQFWPRVRANKPTAVVNSWDSKILPKESNFLGFPGYKVGMTNIGIIDNFSHTLTKGTEINTAVTVLECPPIKVLSVRLSGLDEYGNMQVLKEVQAQVKDKYLNRKIDVQKKSSVIPSVDELIKFAQEYEVYDVKAKVMTTPSATTIGKKKPEILELGVSGSIEEKITFVMSKLGQEIKVGDVYTGGELVDSHGITIGYGHQGAVKRFGVKLTSHKSEKKRRHAGNVGAWTPSRVLTTIPMPGQHGYHERTEWNKWIIKVSSDSSVINPDSGFTGYGLVKSDYLLIKGSIQGPRRRLITFVRATRPNARYPKIAPQITYISR